jgi:ABC-type nitrate/sulfonate/bicarbonate transport system substrate-binding protein
MKSKFIAIELSVLVVLMGCTHEATHTHVVRAAFVPSGYYLPFIVLLGDHLLEKRGYSLELKTYHDNAEMISSFLNGNLDVTAQSAFTMFPVEDEHPGFYKFIYGQYTNGYYFVVPTASRVHRIDDLVNTGSRIATWKSPTAEAYIDLIMKARSLATPRDYVVQKYPSTDWPTALENKAADVAFGFDVPIARLVSTGQFRYLDENPINSLAPSGGRLFNGGAFVSTRLISEDPAKALAIRDALWEALETIYRDPSHVHSLMASALGTTPAIAGAAHYDEFARPNPQVGEAAESTLIILRDRKLVQRTFSAKSLFWQVQE